jgi:hypothetical protein
MEGHLVDHFKTHEMVSDSTLHVIGVISNSARFQSRYRLFREWYERMHKTKNVKVYVVEVAYGDHHHEVTERNHPHHLQLRTKHHLWFKENLINLGVEHLLPHDWKYLAWVDTDVVFHRSDWALKSIHTMQDYPLIQPWGEAVDMGPRYNGMQMFESFCKLVYHGIPIRHPQGSPYQGSKRFGHSGFGWCCTREFYENTQGLFDKAILGSGDHNMAWAAVGKHLHSIHKDMGNGFKRSLEEWQDRAVAISNERLAYVPGIIHHHFHGAKNNRFYVSRWKILIDHKYDPYKDIRYDDQGLMYIHSKPHLEEAIRRYAHLRNEDDIGEV